MKTSSEEVEGEAVLNVARLMLAAARTAQKARCMDSITTTILTGEDKVS